MAVTLVGTADHFEEAATSTTIAVQRTGIVAGNLIVVGVCGLQVCDQVSDGTTTIITEDVSIFQASMGQTISLFSFPNHAGGTKTFTATYAASATFRGIVVIELQGAFASVPLEGVAEATGFDGTPNTGNLSPTPSVDGCYIVGFCVANNILTAGSGFTDLFNDVTVNDACLEGLAQATAAAVAANWTMTTQSWGAVAASYRPDAASSLSLGRRFAINQRLG